MSQFSSLVVGDGSLLIQCSEVWLEAGHSIAGVVTEAREVADWASGRALEVIAPGAGLSARISDLQFDWLFSIANLRILPEDVLSRARQGALNFHDGPLPNYAGLNAPVWALINREQRHGITWHMIEAGVDEGDVVDQRMFDVAADETALTLNTKCYEAGIAGFSEIVRQLGEGGLQPQPQDLSKRQLFARDQRPNGAARLDFRLDAADLAALARGLDHGAYWNPLSLAKIELDGEVCVVTQARESDLTSDAQPGRVLEVDAQGLSVACARGALRLEGLVDRFGARIDPSKRTTVGAVLTSLDASEAKALSAAMDGVTKFDPAHRRDLLALAGSAISLIGEPVQQPSVTSKPIESTATLHEITQAVARLVTMSSGAARFDIAVKGADWPQARGYLSDFAWVTSDHEGIDHATQTALARGPFALDLLLRDRSLKASLTPQIALSAVDSPVEGAALTFAKSDAGVQVYWDETRVSGRALDLLLARFTSALETKSTHLPASEQDLLLHGWNQTERPEDAPLMHKAFEAQVRLTPNETAVVFENQSLSYADLNARANQVAHALLDKGAGPGTLVGLFTRRSLDLMVGALGILKAGSAYVPLDPSYPADRIAHYISDSGAPLILCQKALTADLPGHDSRVIEIDAATEIAAAATENPDVAVAREDLAYLIYTSGSTGTPKGVMVEHQNVANFFTGMDERVEHGEGGTWLAVTSLSFDISVLELFYSLARGFKLVIAGDENRAAISSGTGGVSSDPIDFSVYYWGNDDLKGAKKYELLLEGAKYADQNGFVAVWTPERHFHAFGGPYPNPSVTGAAVAAVTDNIAVRAGSIVAPLHHPARIAEEWAVIDNLTGGRVGLAIASGWQPDDFVLRPENTPPVNKTAMFTTIDQIRALWKGEAVDFPRKSGAPLAVVTQPRPMSDELPIWVTTAGNPETWKDAARHNANILTHLLGQSIDEVQEKIALYHATLRECGFDPAERTVTLMLHTFVGHDREAVREIVREPMKDYLRSAAGLIKQYAWAFPAFKKPEGVSNPFELDLGSLTDEEMEGVLDYAFLRYFEDAGLFGTVDDCVARVEELKKIGVGEVACLIDYGIETQVVLDGLRPLTEVRKACNATRELDPRDFSLAAQIERHNVTHLQCTPSMARMITMNDEACRALKGVKHLMIGGEALPGALVETLGHHTSASIENMYGPTETTIWSTTSTAEQGQGTAPLGTPIANTQLYVLDEDQAVLPIGVAGELLIGGAGVTRGYWQREELTADRFVPNPFAKGRMYRTGDLVRRQADGTLEFLGRVDHQVKLRGHRIELGEIEAALERIEGIDQAVVMAREDSPGDTRLVAYLRGAKIGDHTKIRAALGAQMPAFMVPAHFVEVAEFALTPNKKVDRAQLPAPRAPEPAKPRVAPSTAAPAARDFVENAEDQLAAIWCRILGVASVGPKDNFFDLGGHSLLAVQAHREIRESLGASTLSITDIFRFPTLEGLAKRLTPEPLHDAVSTPQARSAVAEKAAVRADAMSKRRAMRAARMQRLS